MSYSPPDRQRPGRPRRPRPPRLVRPPRILRPLVILLLFSVGFLGAVAQAGADRSWFLSNEDFMDLEVPVDGPGPGWTLAVERDREDPRLEVRSLFLDGELQGWEEVRHSPEGLPVEVRRFREDEEPVEIFFQEIRYRPGGTVRSVRRCRGEECIYVRFAPPGVAGLESIRGTDLTIDIRYGASGRPEYVRRESPEDPLEEEWYEYDQGRLRSSRTVIGTQEVLRRYSEGMLLLEETRRDRILVERIRREYTPEGDLLEKIRETRNRVERDLHFPGVAQGIIRERRINGVLVEQEEAVSPDERVITRLQEGEILFRTWFAGDRATRREVYFEGEVLHVEELGE